VGQASSLHRQDAHPTSHNLFSIAMVKKHLDSIVSSLTPSSSQLQNLLLSLN